MPQEPRLLHATVFENIRFDRDVDLPAVERAARLAHIHDEIMTWSNGYDTLVGPRADAVSGGQQQRLCLARALAATPEVLVLDEPTSALDPKSEALIQESLNTLKHDLTLFIIAHRMSTLDICDRVMVIMGGRLVAFDTIEALRRTTRTTAPPRRSPPAAGLSAGEGTVWQRLFSSPSDRPQRFGHGPSWPGAAAGSPRRRRLPDFFIAGHPKSGTTALYEALRRHPQIYMPDCKEPWFFAPELRERTPPRPEGTPSTLAEYAALFAAAELGQRAGEASAEYLWSRGAAAAIAEVQPAAKVIAVLREPASFLHSLHLQFLQSYVETEPDLRRALALEPERRRGDRSPPHLLAAALLYSEHVRYTEQLARYEALSPSSAGARLRRLPPRPRRVRAHRAALPRGRRERRADAPEANPTVRARSQRLHELVHAVGVGRGPVSRAAKTAIKAVTPRVCAGARSTRRRSGSCSALRRRPTRR